MEQNLEYKIKAAMNTPKTLGYEVNDIGIFEVSQVNNFGSEAKLVIPKEVFIAAYKAYIKGSGLGD